MRVRTLTLLLVTVLMCGVPSANAQRAKSRAPKLDPATAFRMLDEATTRFSYTIETASEAIIARADDIAIRRAAVVWRIRSISAVRRALQDDPQQALADQLTYTVQMRHFLTIGYGKELFGQWQQIAVDAAKAIEEDLIAVFAASASEEEITKMRADLEEWAQRNPIRGVMQRGSERMAFQRGTPSGLDINPLLELPFTPIRLAIGTDQAVDEMQRLQLVLAQASALVNFLPQRLRWETELMFYDIEERRSLQRTLEKFESVSNELARFVDVAETLPATLSAEMQAFAENDAAVDNAQTLAASIEAAAANVAAAGEAWAETTRAIRSLVPERDPDLPAGDPFVIDDYTRAAEAFTATAVELRGLTEQVEALTSRNDRGETPIGVAKAQGVDLIDHLALRMIQVALAIAGVVFVLAMAYRVLSSRITRRAKAG